MNKEKTKVVLLAGGKGTRIREETDITPKPMIKVGKIPVIEQIMNRYIKFGLNPIASVQINAEKSLNKHFL